MKIIKTQDDAYPMAFDDSSSKTYLHRTIIEDDIIFENFINEIKKIRNEIKNVDK